MKVFTAQDKRVLEEIENYGTYETDNSKIGDSTRLETYRTFLEYYKEKHNIPEAKGLIFGLYCFEGKHFKNIEDYIHCIENSAFEGGIQGMNVGDTERVVLELEVPDEIVHKTDYGYFVDFLFCLEEEGECHLEYTDVDCGEKYGTYLGQAIFHKIEEDWIVDVHEIQ